MIQELGEFVGPTVDRVAVARLWRPTAAAAVVNDHPEIRAEGSPLRVPRIGRGAAAMNEDDGRTVALRLVMKRHQLTGSGLTGQPNAASSSRAGPVPLVGSVVHGQQWERNGTRGGNSASLPLFAISRSIAARPPPPRSSTSIRK